MELVVLFARYVWASPNTLLGLVFVPLVRITGGHIHIVDGVLELHGGILTSLLRRCGPLQGGAAAMTLGHVVIARDRHAVEMTRVHERVHVRQCERWGPFFLPAYFLASLWAAVTRQGAYYGNYFERQARLFESKVVERMENDG